LRVSEFQPEYGLIGAGTVNASLIARLPRNGRSLGSVAAVSFRVASRIVNSLGAGTPVRSADELDASRVILFHSSPEQFQTLLDALSAAEVKWPGKLLIFCDCHAEASAAESFRNRGASVASLRGCAMPARMIVEGNGAALALAHRMAKDLGSKTIEITPDSAPAFDAVMTLGCGALTPLIDYATGLLRQCGVRDAEAPKLAAALFEQTARDYSRTGRQSWAWYQRPPVPADIVAQVGAAGEPLRELLGRMILFGMEESGRHRETTRATRSALRANEEPE
jgi:hypothetical protein